MTFQCREEKSIHHHRGKPPFFSFSGSEALWCIPFFPDLWCMPFSLVLPGKWYTPQLFLLCDLGVGRQTEKRGVPRWWCILFFSFAPKLGNNKWGAKRIVRFGGGWTVYLNPHFSWFHMYAPLFEIFQLGDELPAPFFGTRRRNRCREAPEKTSCLFFSAPKLGIAQNLFFMRSSGDSPLR